METIDQEDTGYSMSKKFVLFRLEEILRIGLEVLTILQPCLNTKD